MNEKELICLFLGGKATHRNFFNHDCATPLINSLKEYSEPNGHEMIEAKAGMNE